MSKHLDPTLSAQVRAEALVGLMTLEERASVLNYRSPGIPRLDIPEYNWWNEGLHGVARAGTATMFPQAIALAAMFDRDMMETVGHVIAVEARAKYNSYSALKDRDIYKGLTLWSPNINMFRDPRWGRGHETYGEDPYLTGELGTFFVKGIQGDGPVMMAAACAKHYAVHSGPEGERHTFDASATAKDMEAYYLPHFKALVEAGVEGVMGAYNRLNGEGTCASSFLMKKLEEWGFDGYFVSDYRALEDFYKNHRLTNSDLETAAMAVEAGCHICAGYVYEHVMDAYEKGMLSEAAITKAAIASMRTRIRLGQFDKNCEWDQIPLEVVSCRAHKQVSLEAAHKSMVLLQNNGILPLDARKTQTIGVIGPNANSREALQGNYFGTADRYHTFLEGIQDAFGGRVLYSLGAHLYKNSTTSLGLYQHDRIAEAVAVAKRSDVVILCIGLDADLEGEEGDAGNQFASGDKVDVRLPESQRLLVEKVLEIGKPTIVVIASGSALNVEATQADAILQAWYPGSEGGIALADLLFGKVSPSGKLPITFYESCEPLPPFTDYSLKNRTYLYAENNVLYPFGYGLTYGNIVVKSVTYVDGVATVSAENTGNVTTEDVIQLYMKDNNSVHAVRHHRLCGFKRVHLFPGEWTTVKITLDPTAFDVVDDAGHRFVDSDSFTLYAGVCQPDELSQRLSKTSCVSVNIHLSK
ncbi:MAG: glycoside hydrolase family 3 C-terminal domain-containing protein [Defluviitaleaceae bacterium]|nr:glycoside hydrolase family 3 C-terminal domain-containing protein [Defluviitaleaceae bacterium]